MPHRAVDLDGVSLAQQRAHAAARERRNKCSLPAHQITAMRHQVFDRHHAAGLLGRHFAHEPGRFSQFDDDRCDFATDGRAEVVQPDGLGTRRTRFWKACGAIPDCRGSAARAVSGGGWRRSLKATANSEAGDRNSQHYLLWHRNSG